MPVRLFLQELDGNQYQQFDRYKRWFVEMEKARTMKKPRKAPTPRKSPSQKAGLELLDKLLNQDPRIFEGVPSPEWIRNLELDQAIAAMNAHFEERRKAFELQRKKRDKRILDEFDAISFSGPRDHGTRKTFQESLREVLTHYLRDDYFSDPVLRGATRMIPEHFSVELMSYALYARTQRHVSLLRTLAEQGDTDALQRLVELVLPLVKLINDKGKENPESLGGLPRRYPFWPVLKSEHRDFDEDHRTMLKSFDVGKSFPLVIAEGTRWTAQDAIGRWAVHLCHEIEICQEGRVVGEDGEAWEHKLLKLKKFSAATWPNWWEVAQGLLQHEYIDVVEIQELNQTVKSNADRKSKGRIRKRIFQGLKDKFKSMAGENKL